MSGFLSFSPSDFTLYCSTFNVSFLSFLISYVSAAAFTIVRSTEAQADVIATETAA